MRYVKPWFILCLAAIAHAQVGPTINGIKIISPATFNPQTHRVELTFINDSTDNITAWGYCVKALNGPGDYPSHSFCTVTDPLPTVIEDKIEMAKRPFVAEANCPMCRFIHLGERKILSSDFSSWPEVVNATIEIDLIAYEGGNVEALNNSQGHSDLHQLTNSRSAWLRLKQGLVNTSQTILADANDQHPAITMIRELETQSKQDRGVSGEVRAFKKPRWHEGDDREFVPDNEREYLEQYSAEQKVWVAELAKNQIKGGRL